MTDRFNNPWAQMKEGSVRRLNVETEYNFFWACDDSGRYAFMIEFSSAMPADSFRGQMRGISIAMKRDAYAKFYLILNDNRDWEMFLSVCNDISSHARRVVDEQEMIRIINQRIKRWQRFLQEGNPLSMPENVQMGLIGELKCLIDILVPRFGYKNSILGWVGADKDRQDFSLTDFFLEVKCYTSSKGPSVRISSAGQLDNNLKPLFLMTYGLTRLDEGISVPLLARTLYGLIPGGDMQLREILEDRLAAYGFVIGITQPPFLNYHFDREVCYHVKDAFPRISPDRLDLGVSGVKYTLDLSKCDNFQIDLPF